MKFLIVDGYNVIRSTPPYRELAEDDLDTARAALLADVAAYAADEWAATVVFDGGGNQHSTGEAEKFCGIEVIFSRYGADADSVVESLARSARDRGDTVEVVSSDAATQWAVLGGTAVRRSAPEFAADLRSAEADWRAETPCGPRASRVEERISPEVRARLERIARKGTGA